MMTIQLGLIGDNIASSHSPALHKLLGRLAGLDVSYDLLIPKQLGLSWLEIIHQRVQGKFVGVNITQPYKTKVLDIVTPATAEVQSIGAVNTVVHDADGELLGYNTDHTGFLRAFTTKWTQTPGRVLLLGGGGVGRAIGMALASLIHQQNHGQLYIYDKNQKNSSSLAQDINILYPQTAYCCEDDPWDFDYDGLVNATPLGMDGICGTTPLPDGYIPGVSWGFDAVYTPVETEFRARLLQSNAEFLSGYELFVAQALDCFALFTGVLMEDSQELRMMLAKECS